MRYMFAKRGDSRLFCHIGHNAQLLMLSPKFIFQLSHVARNGRLRNMQQFRSLVPMDFRDRGCIANSDARTLHS